MSKLGKVIVLVAVTLLLLLGIFIGVRFAPGRSGAITYNTPALLTQVQALSELVTVKYVIEKVEVLEVPSENLVGQALGSHNRILLLAHGVVKAGIDFQRLTPEDLQVEGKKIIVRMPNARITDAYLDEQETRVIDRTTGLLAPPAKDLEQTTRRNALDSIQRAARKSGILSEADQRARAQLSTLFKQLGFETVEFR
jgi:hypothetical protein